MAERDLSLIPPISDTEPKWVAGVLQNFDVFLKDHASCEKKASGMALNVAAHYPDKPNLLEAMVDLAVEELNHYREVIKLLLARDIPPGADVKDPYVNALNNQVRRGSENFLLDRLLVGAVVERRGAQRFALVAAHINEAEFSEFYHRIAVSEERHWQLFVELAQDHCASRDVIPRLVELSHFENQLVSTLPLRPALH